MSIIHKRYEKFAIITFVLISDSATMSIYFWPFIMPPQWTITYFCQRVLTDGSSWQSPFNHIISLEIAVWLLPGDGGQVLNKWLAMIIHDIWFHLGMTSVCYPCYVSHSSYKMYASSTWCVHMVNFCPSTVLYIMMYHMMLCKIWQHEYDLYYMICD